MRDESDSFAPVMRIVSAVPEAPDAPLRDLLHGRLRSCLVVLASAFLVFLIQGAVAPTRRTVPVAYQAAVGGLLVLASVLLNGPSRPSLPRTL